MHISKTTELLQQYKVIKDLISEIELFSRASSTEDPYVVSLQQKLESELDTFRSIYDDYSMIPEYEGGFDKRRLRHDKKFMTFLSEYLPDIYNDIEYPVYGGKHKPSHLKSSRKSKRKVMVSKKSTRKNKKSTRKTKKPIRKGK